MLVYRSTANTSTQKNDYAGLLDAIVDKSKAYGQKIRHEFFNGERIVGYKGPRDKVSLFDRIKIVVDEIRNIDARQLFIDMEVAYFLYTNTHFDGYIAAAYGATTYPVLKELNFQVVKDPYTAMQELSMFVGGVLPRKHAEIINISDKDRIAQYGFNKNSFRHPVKLSQLYKEKK